MSNSNKKQPIGVFGKATTVEFFLLSQLFKVSGCSRKFTEDAAFEEFAEGNIPYVTTSAVNNGIKRLIGKGTEPGNVITIDSATVGSAFYQPLPFAGSDHVEKLTPLVENNVPLVPMDEAVGLFLCALLSMEKFKYGYGRKFNQTRIEQTKLPLPVKDEAAKAKKAAYTVRDIDWDAVRKLMREVMTRGGANILQQLNAANSLPDETPFLSIPAKSVSVKLPVEV